MGVKRLFRGLKNLYDFEMGKGRRLLDAYRFPGCRPLSRIHGVFGDPKARVIRLERTQKKRSAAAVAGYTTATTTRPCDGCETCRAGMPGYTWKWKFDGFGARGAAR